MAKDKMADDVPTQESSDSSGADRAAELRKQKAVEVAVFDRTHAGGDPVPIVIEPEPEQKT
jgi:hypothetical protein